MMEHFSEAQYIVPNRSNEQNQLIWSLYGFLLDENFWSSNGFERFGFSIDSLPQQQRTAVPLQGFSSDSIWSQPLQGNQVSFHNYIHSKLHGFRVFEAIKKRLASSLWCCQAQWHPRCGLSRWLQIKATLMVSSTTGFASRRALALQRTSLRQRGTSRWLQIKAMKRHSRAASVVHRDLPDPLPFPCGQCRSAMSKIGGRNQRFRGLLAIRAFDSRECRQPGVEGKAPLQEEASVPPQRRLAAARTVRGEDRNWDLAAEFIASVGNAVHRLPEAQNFDESTETKMASKEIPLCHHQEVAVGASPPCLCDRRMPRPNPLLPCRMLSLPGRWNSAQSKIWSAVLFRMLSRPHST